jgi:hypothetical protein
MTRPAAVDLDHATVVAFYDRKPPPLLQLVVQVQATVAEVVGDAFQPRPVADVHATIIGLDGAADDPRRRDLSGLLRHVDEAFAAAPARIRFGGFPPDYTAVFSNGRTLFERGLTVGGNQVVLIGWPVREDSAGDDQPTDRLGRLRREAERYGFRHKYHRTGDDLDIDCYLVVGDLDPPAPPDAGLLAHAVADGPLATPTTVHLTAADLLLAEYVSARLPHESTRAWPVASG